MAVGAVKCSWGAWFAAVVNRIVAPANAFPGVQLSCAAVVIVTVYVTPGASPLWWISRVLPAHRKVMSAGSGETVMAACVATGSMDSDQASMITWFVGTFCWLLRGGDFRGGAAEWMRNVPPVRRVERPRGSIAVISMWAFSSLIAGTLQGTVGVPDSPGPTLVMKARPPGVLT